MQNTIYNSAFPMFQENDFKWLNCVTWLLSVHAGCFLWKTGISKKGIINIFIVYFSLFFSITHSGICNIKCMGLYKIYLFPVTCQHSNELVSEIKFKCTIDYNLKTYYEFLKHYTVSHTDIFYWNYKIKGVGGNSYNWTRVEWSLRSVYIWRGTVKMSQVNVSRIWSEICVIR